MGTEEHIATNMVTPPMRTDARLFTLAQWLSPSFPIGAFAFSHGIEQAIKSGWITDADSLQNWLEDCLEFGSVRSDAILLRLAYSTEDIKSLDEEARAFAASRERLFESERQGVAFVKTVNAVWGLDLTETVLPVAVGRAVRMADLDLEQAVLLYLQSFLSNLMSASIRLMPLGQTDGQRVLFQLQDAAVDVATDTQNATIEDMFSNAFLSDITSMQHETLEPRLFQS
ncbi:MAG: urease accessory protein UreF [Boseongicola sp.]|nr:urease accessory protein UreF [Boseongicola sp.]MDD9978102.1 urease accessory protein UreF [Boseongicola sp.]